MTYRENGNQLFKLSLPYAMKGGVEQSNYYHNKHKHTYRLWMEFQQVYN